MKTRQVRFAVPPGQYLLEELKAREIHFLEFKAVVPDLTTEAELECGATAITESIANAIERALDMPAVVWLELERNFREAIAAGAPVLCAEAVEAAQAKAASGKLLLRLPAGLHRRAADAAKAEGISLNQLLLSYIAEGIGRTESHR